MRGTLCAPSRPDASSTRYRNSPSFHLHRWLGGLQLWFVVCNWCFCLCSCSSCARVKLQKWLTHSLVQYLPPSLSILSLQFISSAIEQSLPAQPSIQSQRYSPFSSVHCPCREQPFSQPAVAKRRDWRMSISGEVKENGEKVKICLAMLRD